MKLLSAMIFCLFFGVAADAQRVENSPPTKDADEITKFTNSPELEKLLTDAVEQIVSTKTAKPLRREEIAVTLVDLSDKKALRTANVNGETQIYPASVVKLFYLAAIHRWLEDEKIRATPELERGLRDMIVDSSNEATQYILDVLTDTSSGAELSAKEFEKWSFKRNAVNRYYQSLGYKNINVNQKTHCEDAYGREQQFRNYRGENRNMLTTNATARLMTEIALGEMVTAERSRKMLDLLVRDPFSSKNDGQAKNYTGLSLIDLDLKDAKLYSKAGWTSNSRHDAAFIEFPDGKKIVLVIFTENNADRKDIIAEIAKFVISSIRDGK